MSRVFDKTVAVNVTLCTHLYGQAFVTVLTVHTAASENRVLLHVRLAPQIWANCMLRGAIPSSTLMLKTGAASESR